MIKLIKRILLIAILLFAVVTLYRTRENVKQVLSYRSLVQQTLKSQDTTENEALVLAIIYTETKGQTSGDVMQSSESTSGVANTITDSKESIKQGVTTLSANLKLAARKKVDIWTAVQAYNYGQAYINYVADHGKKNTIKVSTDYSKTVVAPSLGNTDGETIFYHHPIALLLGKGKLYKNGGNIYYSRQVKFNLFVIKLFSYTL